MRIIDMQGFCVRLDRQTEFQDWLRKNEGRIRSSYPAGTEYGGVYAAVYSSEKQAGEYFWLDILDSYGAMDTLAALGKDADSEYAKVGREMMEYIDFDRASPYSRTLMKAVVDATIVDAPKP
jgi:hypothetical protein